MTPSREEKMIKKMDEIFAIIEEVECELKAVKSEQQSTTTHLKSNDIKIAKLEEAMRKGPDVSSVDGVVAQKRKGRRWYSIG